jgi:hypothetical protein
MGRAVPYASLLRLTSNTVLLTATQIGLDGSCPLCSESSRVVTGSLRGGLGVGWEGLCGVDIVVRETFVRCLAGGVI